MIDIPDHVRDLIYEALTNAQQGGYDADVRQHPDLVADDLYDCDADIECLLEDGVITHAQLSIVVADWQREHNV